MQARPRHHLTQPSDEPQSHFSTIFISKVATLIATDYEQKKSGGTVDIIATDADGTETEHSVLIFSTDVDEAPEAIALDGSTLREGEAGQVIGTFSATDPEDDSLTFQLAPEARW